MSTEQRNDNERSEFEQSDEPAASDLADALSAPATDEFVVTEEKKPVSRSTLVHVCGAA